MAEKAEKVAFVSGHLGGSVLEINQVTLVAPATVLLWSILQSSLSLFTPYTAASCLVDFFLNCAAILFACTLYSSTPILLNLLILLPAALVFVSSKLPGKTKIPQNKPAKPKISEKNSDAKDPFPIKPFVTTYRGSMLVVTCVAILAVDFRVFPRRFAKVENWGTSLMDLGVGSFVFSAGTVAARPILKQQISGKTTSLSSRLITALRHSLPLLVLGLIRVYSVKGLDYAEHVTEYGVHWNFFFTLALLSPFVALFDSAFSILPSYAGLALILGAGYEVCLDSTDLKEYIMVAPRTDLLSKNREGVFSFIGYLAIFLAGQATGMFILPKEPSKSAAFRQSILGKLTIWSCTWTLLYLFATSYNFGLNLRVSRRLANLPYFLWVAAFNCCQLTVFYLIEKTLFPESQQASTKSRRGQEASSQILRAFNRNGLAVFLLANLLTGLVNLTMPTLAMSDLQAMSVLLVYSAVLSAVALVLNAWDISIKL